MVAMVVMLSACASYTPNEPLARYDQQAGYRYELLDKTDNSDDLFVILTFSGGGTRAAALAYGVLEKLRDTRVDLDGIERNLLDEVDVISSVSGGSFTAAYYTLNGAEIFDPEGVFHQNFLYNNVESQLKKKLVNPYNWARLASPTFGRIEIAQEVYQNLLFGNATYSELAGRKPFLMVNATDMVKGSPFTFIQSQLDPMCADLNSIPIARAVAASSNFPVAFSPLTLNSYPGTCDYEEPDWLTVALKDVESNPRRYYRARELQTYQQPDRRYAHLLDGGVADNIGLRGPLTAMRSGDPAWSLVTKMGLEEIQKLVVIVVDAKSMSESRLDKKPSAPGLVTVINNIATVPLDNYSADTVELLRDTLRRRVDAQDKADLHKVGIYRVYVGFDQIQDEQERDEFFNIETNFGLPADQVNALRRIGGELLEKSVCFQALTDQPDALEKSECRY
jgi:NTE family protein